ncbi:MAG: DUF86 domain-containing protein [Phycisphaeraceae bacterium JB051]
MLPEPDRIRIQHMLDAAKQAISFADGFSQEQLVDDLKTTFALVKCIEIIGEAATHVTDETQQAIPSVPWRIAKAMRNRLVHVYFDIDVNILWSTVTNDLPQLAELLEKALADNKPAE